MPAMPEQPELPGVGAEPAAPAAEGGESVEGVSLNGAQIAALMQIVQAVSDGTMPEAAGVEIIASTLPISRDKVLQIFGALGKQKRRKRKRRRPDGDPNQSDLFG